MAVNIKKNYDPFLKAQPEKTTKQIWVLKKIIFQLYGNFITH